MQTLLFTNCARRKNVSLQRISLAIRIAVCLAALCPPTLTSQTPVQPGRLVVTSTPSGAKITVNSQATKQLTDATFVVPPGKYTVSVAGGAGSLNCPDKEVQVSSGQSTSVHCAGTGWTQNVQLTSQEFRTLGTN